VNALALSPDGRYVASVGGDRDIQIIDGKTWKSARKSVADADVKDIVFTRTGDLVVAGDRSPKLMNCVYVWQWNANKVVATWNDAASVVVVAISPDGKLVAAIEGDGRVRMMSRDHNSTVLVETGQPAYRRTSLGFSPDGKTLLTGGINGVVGRWRLAVQPRQVSRGKSDHFDAEFNSSIRAVGYSPNGTYVASAHEDGTARIYLERKGLQHRMSGHAGGATAVAFTPDSKMLVSGGADRTIRVWDVATGDLLWEVPGHSGPITRVVVPTADTIISASADATVRYWRRSGDVDPALAGVLADAARNRPARKTSLPPPGASELTKSKALIKDLFAADFAKATDETGRRGLAMKLMAQARQEENLPAERYAALELALNLAIEAKDAKLAIEAADEFGVWFAGDPLPRLVETCQGLAKACRSPQERTLLAKGVLSVVDDAVSTDRYVEASRLMEIATAAASAARNSELQEAAKALSARIETAKSAWDAYQAALRTLKGNSADPAANLEAGRFLCFVRGQWEKGIPYLSRCSNERLREAAAKELSEPDGVEEWESLGDLWQAAATGGLSADKPGCAAAAEYWYRKALDAAAGLRKVKIQRSLDAIGPTPQHLRRTAAK
jgi:hypothetical protein